VHALNSPWKDLDLTVSKFPDLDKLSLRSFVISVPILLSLHRNDIQKIINIWPDLQHLELTSCRPFRLGFDVLVDIALGLRNLSQLALSVDLQNLPSAEEIPLLCHGLESLALNISSMPPDIANFAQSVDKIFPRLDSACWKFNCSEHPDFHNNATRLLVMLQTARRYEAKRACLGIDMNGVNVDNK
jgi:hypothetical protein